MFVRVFGLCFLVTVEEMSLFCSFWFLSFDGCFMTGHFQCMYFSSSLCLVSSNFLLTKLAVLMIKNETKLNTLDT